MYVIRRTIRMKKNELSNGNKVGNSMNVKNIEQKILSAHFSFPFIGLQSFSRMSKFAVYKSLSGEKFHNDTSLGESSSTKKGRTFSCDKCGKCYRIAQSMYAHRKYECGKQPEYECQYCQKKFHRPGNMKSHIINVHNSALIQYHNLR